MNKSVKRLFTQSIWKNIPEVPKDKILHENMLYNEEKNTNKVNLTIGAYRDENGKPWILPSVKLAAKKIDINPEHNYEYIKMTGDREFTEMSVALAYGRDQNTGLLANKYTMDQIAQVQTLSGAGGVFFSLQMIKNFYNNFDGIVYTSQPTWPVHNSMTQMQGLQVKHYRYYDLENRVFDYNAMLEDLKAMPENSFVIMHPVGHNPTGFDPSHAQWREILDVVKEKNFFILMDMPYQGFVSGDPEKDGYAVRLFAENDVNMFVAQSFAKNFGLYGHRIGVLSTPNQDVELVEKMNKYFGHMTRNTYSSPPRFGSDVIKTILSDPDLVKMWKRDLRTMSNRIIKMRQMLYEELQKCGVKDDWSYVLRQQGMFAFTHLQPNHAQELKKKFAIYMLENGRISLTGLTEKNVDYVAKGIAEVTK